MRDLLKQKIRATEKLRYRADYERLWTFRPSAAPYNDQIGFFYCTARERWVFGGNRSGKTESAVVDCILFAAGEHPVRSASPSGRFTAGWPPGVDAPIQGGGNVGSPTDHLDQNSKKMGMSHQEKETCSGLVSNAEAEQLRTRRQVYANPQEIKRGVQSTPILSHPHQNSNPRFAPPVYIRYCAPTYEDSIRGVILKKFQQLVPRYLLRGGSWDKAWSEGSRVLYFANGSQVKFMTYKQWDAAPGSYGGDDCHAIYMDEHGIEAIYRENSMRLADYNGYLVGSMTPELGLVWEEGHVMEPPEGLTVDHWFFSTERNPYLSQEGVAAVKASITDERLAAAKLEGRFVSLSGLVMPMWSRNVHVVADFEIPTHWPRVLSIDPHRRKPTALDWVAWSDEGEACVYRWLWGVGGHQKMTVEDLKAFIRAKNAGENVVLMLADEAQGGTGKDIFGQESVIKMLRSDPNGLRIFGTNQSSEKKFEAGIYKFWEYLKSGKFKVFQSCDYGSGAVVDGFRCASLPWQMQHYQYKGLQKQDEETFREKVRGVDDDHIDNCRYILMAGDPNRKRRTYYKPERRSVDEFTGL